MPGYLGIDPGKAGGIALLEHQSIAQAWPMPDSEADLWALLEDCKAQGVVLALLERAQAYPGMGRSGAFNYGAGYGALRMALAGLQIPFELVSPAKWQSAMRCKSGGDKNVTKRKAQELFPALRITHKIADALLIAEYGRRVYGR